MRVLSIDVASIGAGGGSIAAVNFGDLTVGPRSAGANPGPVCYGRGGTEPTSTDADLLLGVLDPDNFIGGRMKLDVEAARKAIEEKIAKPLGMGVVEAAWGIREVLDNKMADLLRRVTIARGYDPRDFTLFANGGAGPSHAWVLARELGLDGFVVPAAATAQSAYGTANSDIIFTADRPVYVRVKGRDVPGDEDCRRLQDALRSAAEEVVSGVALASTRGEARAQRTAAIRYRGQTNHLDIPLNGDGFTPETYRTLVADFERQYETLFGRGAGFAAAGFEILSIRVLGTGSLPPPAMASVGEALEKMGERPVVFDDPKQPLPTAIYRTTFPRNGEKVAGPCIIEFPGQSVVVPPGAAAEADAYGNLHVRIKR